MVKRAKAKPKVDYRHRWPTQQTLVDSRVSLAASRSKWQWKFRVGWLRRLNRRSSPEPGKSTHPYDTVISEQESDSGSGPRPTSTLDEDSQRCWKVFTRMPNSPSPLPPVPKFSHIKEELRSETPRTPVQFLRHLTGPKKSPLPRPRTASSFDYDRPTVKCTKSTVQMSELQPKFSHMKEYSRPETPRTPVQFLRHLTGPKKSPLPRPRTASSFDYDKPTVKCTKSTVQTSDLQPKVTRAVAKQPKTLSVKFRSFVKNIFRRGSPGRRRTARALAGQNKGDRNLAPVRVRRLQ